MLFKKYLNMIFSWSFLILNTSNNILNKLIAYGHFKFWSKLFKDSKHALKQTKILNFKIKINNEPTIHHFKIFILNYNIILLNHSFSKRKIAVISLTKNKNWNEKYHKQVQFYIVVKLYFRWKNENLQIFRFKNYKAFYSLK